MAKKETTKVVVSDELKALRKRAKELDIDFDKETTEAELQILVDTAEAAAKAQAEAGETVKTDETPTNDPRPIDPEGGTLLKEHKGIKLMEENGNIFLQRGNQVLGTFSTREEGLRHMENLSRF